MVKVVRTSDGKYHRIKTSEDVSKQRRRLRARNIRNENNRSTRDVVERAGVISRAARNAERQIDRQLQRSRINVREARERAVNNLTRVSSNRERQQRYSGGRRFMTPFRALSNRDAAYTRFDARNGLTQENGITSRVDSNLNFFMQGGSTGQTMDKGTRSKMKAFYYRQQRKAQGLTAG